MLTLYFKLFLSRMKKNRHRIVILTVYIFPWFFIGAMAQKASGATSVTHVETLNVARIHSMSEMGKAIGLLEDTADAAVKEGRFSLSLQQQILSKSGECIGKLMTLQESAGGEQGGGKQKASVLLSQIRGVIGNIQEINKKTISELQENHLDTLKDPAPFFVSEAWRKPNYLISLSDYWLGWSGYYAGLLYDENAPQRRKVLSEAIDSFSRANIDFADNAINAKSLFGRALCYKGLQSYERAIRDLKAVKEKIGPAEDLYYRCVHEEAFISYETGNIGQALALLDRVYEGASSGSIPKDILAGFDGLRAKIMLAWLEKEKTPAGKTGPDTNEKFRDTFARLGRLARENKSMAAEFYRYVQSHAEKLAAVSFTELGPIGTLAVADLLFDRQQYAEALPYYQHLSTSTGMPSEVMMDNVFFRLSYIYCKQKQWAAALPLLEHFRTKFPESASLKEAARLYYVAASQSFSVNPDDKTYTRYIEATRIYLEGCRDCPDRSEAHFQMGMHYQKAGKTESAARAYSLVKEDSPNYGTALYQRLVFTVEALEKLKGAGREKSETAGKLYKEGGKLLTACQTFLHGKETSLSPPLMEARMLLLQCRLHGFGPDAALKEALQRLEGFERRYPAEKQLGVTATKLRIDGFHRLEMAKAAEEEISRFVAESDVDSEQYAFLQDCANRFYQEAKLHRKKEAKTPAGRETSMALFIYGKLLEIAMNTPAYRKDTEAVRLRMAEIHSDEGRADQAVDLYREVLSENPRSADAVFNLGAAYEKLGEWEKALSCWRRFSEGVKAGTAYWYESRYRTATALIELGKRDKACTIAKMTRVLHPDFDDDELEKKFDDLSNEVCPKETP